MVNIQERIDLIRDSRIQVFTGVKDKQEARDKLNSEIDEFLAKGGEINEVPLGHTAFGKGGLSAKVAAGWERSPNAIEIHETSNEDILERNKSISKKPFKVKTERSSSNNATKQIIQSRNLKQIIAKFGNGDRKRFCDLVGVSVPSFNNVARMDAVFSDESFDRVLLVLETFEFTPRVKKPKYTKSTNPDHLRRTSVIEARKKAIIDGKSEFMAECSNHGMTRYVFEGKYGGRCCACRKEQNLKYRKKLKGEL
jgi:hypothetical protein